MSNDVVICLFASFGYDRAAQGVAGAGRGLAAMLGGSLKALIVGAPDDEMKAGVAAVADAVSVADDPGLAEYQPEMYLAALEQLCRKAAPAVVLLGSDVASLELTPRLAARLGGSPMSDGTALTAADGVIRVTRSAYGGKAEAVFELKRSPAVVWLRARGFEPAAATGAEAAVEAASVELPDAPPTRIVERHVEELEGIPLEEAQLVVGGGRGLGGAEPFEDLKSLAGVMTAAVAGSRSACDEGWVPPSWQVVCPTPRRSAPSIPIPTRRSSDTAASASWRTTRRSCRR